MKKKSLGKQVSLIFALIAVIFVVESGVIAFVNQTEAHQNEIIEDLEELTLHLCDLIQDNGDEFIYLKKWYKEHPDQVQIPLDFRGDLDNSREAFYKYATEHYDGRIPGGGLSFDEMDEEAMRLYGIYRFEYWFDIFMETAEKFDMSYVYFIYPEEGRTHTMNYMIDPAMLTEIAADGTEMLKLNITAYEDPEIHQYMWEAWDSGEAPNSVDTLDNEFGYVYTYCQPLIIGDEKVGLVCVDVNVDRVNAIIRYSVMRQVLTSFAIFILAALALYTFIKKMMFDRILKLDGEVSKYSDEKDPSIAGEIKENKGQNDELGALSDGFADMIVSLDEYMEDLQKVTAERERIGAELNVAASIQADMLPSIFPPFPENPMIDLYATMDPAKEVGGDFYDFFMVDDTHLALVIADVSGKGVPAALFMVIAKTLIKNQTSMGKSPAEVFENVNNQLAEGNESCLFVTVWMAIVDLETGDVVVANAGHENPAVCKKDGNFEIMKFKHSPAIATMKGIKYQESVHHLDRGDTIFVYTDGVPEATNAENKMFGEERLEKSLNKYKTLALEDLLPAIRRDVDDFVAGAPQFDDITMLAFRLQGSDEE